MTPIKNFLAVTTAAMIGVTGITGALPVTAFAHEPPAANQEAGVDSGILPIRESAEKAGLDVIYVRSLADYGGDGSKDHPLKDFKDAYRQVKENGRIVLLDATPIQNDDNNSDQGIFTFSKPVTIEGQESGVLSARVPVQLAADVTFKNVGFYASEVYLNGHTMTMENVTNYKSNDRRPTFFGGSYQNKPVNQGPKSTLNITGSVGNPLEIKNIYSGSATGDSSIDVDFKLNSGVKVLESVHAGGENGKVTGTVNVSAGNINVKKFQNPHKSPNTSLEFHDFHSVRDLSVDGFKNVSLDQSTITLASTDSFSNIDGHLSVQNESKLDISQAITNLTVGSFAGTADSKLVLRKDGKLDIKGDFTGAIEFRTQNGAVDTSGPVTENHTYISSANTSSGRILYKPFFNQTHFMMEIQKEGNRQNWVAAKNQPNKITSIEVTQEKKVQIPTADDAEFDVTVKVEADKTLNFMPQFEIQILGADHTPIDENDAYAWFDDNSWLDNRPTKLLVNVYDDTLPAGTYSIVIKELTTNVQFDLEFEFVKDVKSQYTIHFVQNGGTGSMPSQTVVVGEATTLHLNQFEKIGHSFQGWALTESGSVAYQDGAVVRDLAQTAGQVVNLYAVWAPNSYNVTFDSQNGSQNQTQSVTYGHSITEPDAPVKTGYTFAGWYTDESYTSKWNFGSDTMPAGNITLYAKWEQIPVPFQDVRESDYFYEAVQWAVARGITAGASPTQFDPHGRSTRAQSVTMLWRRFNSPEVGAGHGFDDVSGGDYYEKSVRWAKSLGIVSGVAPGQFDPHGVTTRGQIVTMLWRAAGSPIVEDDTVFSDVRPDDYFAQAVKWAKAKGITAGIGGGKFGPHEPCTRAQMVSFLYKF